MGVSRLIGLDIGGLYVCYCKKLLTFQSFLCNTKNKLNQMVEVKSNLFLLFSWEGFCCDLDYKAGMSPIFSKISFLSPHLPPFFHR